ncbi:MAG: hypothetical protein JWO67_1774, partial [Streptosporangiaceae bacterium]|nr:hypothetical protein [Streptosporangiaceae bacterium]
MVDLLRALRRPAPQPAAPPEPAPRWFPPRDLRTGLDPADPANAELLDVCPLCGMHDPLLRADVTDWHGWPAHAACKRFTPPELPPRRPPAPAVPVVPSGTVGSSARWFWPPADETRPRTIRIRPGKGMQVLVTVARAGEGTRHFALPVDPANPHLPRIDTVALIGDSAGVIPGHPSADPIGSALPPTVHPIGLVYVPPGASSLTKG